MHNAFITYLKTFLLFVGIICNVYTAGFVIGAGGVLESFHWFSQFPKIEHRQKMFPGCEPPLAAVQSKWFT